MISIGSTPEEWSKFAPSFMKLVTDGPGMPPAQDMTKTGHIAYPFTSAKASYIGEHHDISRRQVCNESADDATIRARAFPCYSIDHYVRGQGNVKQANG